jgi:hypothetical protein
MFGTKDIIYLICERCRSDDIINLSLTCKYIRAYCANNLVFVDSATTEHLTVGHKIKITRKLLFGHPILLIVDRTRVDVTHYVSGSDIILSVNSLFRKHKIYVFSDFNYRVFIIVTLYEHLSQPCFVSAYQFTKILRPYPTHGQTDVIPIHKQRKMIEFYVNIYYPNQNYEVVAEMVKNLASLF